MCSNRYERCCLGTIHSDSAQLVISHQEGDRYNHTTSTQFLDTATQPIMIVTDAFDNLGRPEYSYRMKKILQGRKI